MEPTNNPIQQDINEMTDSGTLAPTVMQQGTGNPPLQSAQNTPAPQPNNPPLQSAQSGPNPMPNVPNTPRQPQNMPQPQPQQPSLRDRVFDAILKAGAGTPVQGPDGKPLPMTRGIMGKAIIANALAGMMAGYGSSQYVNGKFGPVKVNDPAKAFAAGAQAATQQQQQRQQQVDDAQARAYNTLKRNLDLHATMMNAQKLDYDQQQQLLKDTQPLLDGLEAFDSANTDPNTPKMILDRGLTADELLQKYHLLKNNAILDGWRPAMDSSGQQIMHDGVPQYEPTFTALNNQAILHWNDALRDSLSPNNPIVARIPTNAPIQAKAILGMVQNNMNYQIAQGALDKWAQQSDTVNGTTGTQAKIDDLMKNSPIIRRAIPKINKYIGEDPDVMLAGLRKEQDSSAQAAAGVLASALGIDEDKWKQKREADQKKVAADQAVATKMAEDSAMRQTPEGQLKLRKMQLENQQLAQSVAQADAQTKGINVPKNFVANPKSNEMDAGELQKDLLAKGVDVPSNFSALYAIAHNAADLSTLPTTPRKGVNVMPRDQALSYIRTFINPQYQEGDFSAAKKLSGELASTRTGTAGGTLLSAGTAANHLNLLEQAGEALHNGDVQAINRLANVLNVAIGKSPAVTFQAIAEQVNSEVAKVVAGGQPNEPELKANREILNNNQSPEQIRNVIRSYVGLMNGRIGEIDDRSMQYFGRHVKGISPTTVQVFNKYGFTAPGQPTGATGQVKGSDGNLYWTDGKNNLGKVQ